MLEPTNRFTLVDALRPPSGHALDVAVGTTFTLDLDALLLATVSFAVFDRLDTDDGRPDPIALLESVRRHADNITVSPRPAPCRVPATTRRSWPTSRTRSFPCAHQSRGTCSTPKCGR